MNYSATTLFIVDEGIDTGPIVFSKKYFFLEKKQRQGRTTQKTELGMHQNPNFQ